MINKSIFGYAMLDYMSELNKDILDMYIPLVCHSITKSKIDKIDNVLVKNLLNDDYGLDKITYGAVDAILSKMDRNDLLAGTKNQYTPQWEKITKITQKKIELGIEEDYKELCNAILYYAKSFRSETTFEDVDNALMVFVEQYGAEIIIDEDNFSQKLNRKKEASTLNYIISKFVLEHQESRYAIILEKIAKGSAISRITSLEHFDEYKSKMKGVIIALDAPIIYSLLGLNGEGAKLLNEELIDLLEEQGCIFVIYNQHYNEVHNTLSDAINRLLTKKYDIHLASRVLKFAVRENLSSEQIQVKLNYLEELIKNKHIEVSEAPDCPPKYTDIDIESLEKDIKNIYKKTGSNHFYDFTKERIANDADVISYIFRLRNNVAATNLKNCKALLITNNTAIAYASRHHKYSKVANLIPPCVTDVFISTMLWLNYPQHNTSLNKKMLLNICFSNTTLDNALLCRFYERAEKTFEKDALCDESILIMKHTKLAMQLLEQKTCNNSDLYTDKTYDEIIQDLEIEEHKEKQELKDKILIVKEKCKIISTTITKGIFIIIEVFLASAFILAKFISITDWTSLCNITKNVIFLLIIGLTTFWGLLNWTKVIQPKLTYMQRLESWIQRKLEFYFLKEKK